jgi:hypothetical protein
MNSAPPALADLNADELREMVTGLLQKVASNTEKIKADAAQEREDERRATQLAR